MAVENAKTVSVKGDAKQLKNKVVEEITYIGDMRLVGLVYDVDREKHPDPIGYVVFVEKNNQTRTVELPVLLSMYANFKFSNIVIQPGKANKAPTFNDIECTECAIDNLLKFYYNVQSKQLVPLEPKKKAIYVLGTVYNEKGTKKGYRILTQETLSKPQKVMDITVSDIKYYADSGVSLINMHTNAKGSLIANKQDNTIKIVVKTPVENTVKKDKLNNYGHKVSQVNKDKYLNRLSRYFVTCLRNTDTYGEDVSSYPWPKGSFVKTYSDIRDKQKVVPKTEHELSGPLMLRVFKEELYPFCTNKAEQSLFLQHYKRATETLAAKDTILKEDYIGMVQFLLRSPTFSGLKIKFGQNKFSEGVHEYNHRRPNILLVSDVADRIYVNGSPLNKYNCTTVDKSGLVALNDISTESDMVVKVVNNVRLDKDYFETLDNFDAIEKSLGVEHFFTLVTDQSRAKTSYAFSDYLNFMISPKNMKVIKDNAKYFGDYALAYHFERLIKSFINYGELPEDTINLGKGRFGYYNSQADEYNEQNKLAMEFISIVGSVCNPTIYEYYRNKYPEFVPAVDTQGLHIDNNNNVLLYKYYRTGFKGFTRNRQKGKLNMQAIYGVILPFASEQLCDYFERKLKQDKIKGASFFSLYYVKTMNFKYDIDNALSKH